MKTLGNILWLIFTGIVSAVSWFLLGVIWCITIIGEARAYPVWSDRLVKHAPVGKNRQAETAISRS